MEKTKKLLRNLIIFIVLIVITFYIILKDQNITEIFDIVKNVKKEFILISILCMFFYVTCEAINIGRTLKALNEKSTFLENMKYAFIGFFFSSITPAASGGQPMQIYYMHKNKISVANSTLTLLINLSCVQIVTISFALFSLIFRYKDLNKGLIWLFVFGVSINFIGLTIFLIGIFSKKMSRGLINIFVKILKFFKLKNIEGLQEKFESELEQYQASAIYIRNNKLIMLKTLITTYIQYIAFYSISYFVYCSFGLSKYNAFEIITMQSVLYATVSGLPSPGAVGVSEGGFIAIFRKIYTEARINSAMLLTRGVNFYLFVILSSIIVIINAIKKKREVE